MPGYIKQLRNMSKDERDAAIDKLISDSFGEICDDSTFSDVSAGTNATGWGGDVYEIVDEVTEDDLEGDELRVSITYSATGDQEEDKGLLGDVIDGTAVAVIDDDGTVTYEEVTAEVNLGEDEDDEADIYVDDE